MFHWYSRWSTRHLILAQLLYVTITAQAQKDPQKIVEAGPQFSIVSVRPSNPDERSIYKWSETGLVENANTLFWIIQTAYGLPEARQIEGAPSWARRQRYDVLGKVNEDEIQTLATLSPSSRGKLLQKVLAERFGLSFHWEDRTFSEYALTVADSQRVAAAILPANSEDIAKPQWKLSTSPYSVDAHGATIDQLCYNVLGTEAQQLVINQTGITGKFNFQLRWSRIDMNANTPPSPDTDSEPDIFSAVRQQLGLKLSPIKVPMQVLVVDSLHEPSAN